MEINIQYHINLNNQQKNSGHLNLEWVNAKHVQDLDHLLVFNILALTILLIYYAYLS